MAKVYLSPAYHKFNPCSIAGCDETTHNYLYMDEVVKFLTACGIEWKRGPRRVPKSNEDGNALMRQAVAESNAFKADIHYVSHTNASTNLSDGIGNGKAKGCRPIIYKGSSRGEKLAEYMIARRREVYDGAITLNRRTDLYELRAPAAVSFYEEHVFHDNPEDAQWFHDHMKDVARSAVQGMCDYLGIPFVEPTEDEVVDGDYVSMADYMALKDELKAEKVKAAEELAASDACIERVRSALKAYDNGKD